MKSLKSGTILVLFLLLPFFLSGQSGLTAQSKEKPVLSKEASPLAERYVKININNISTTIYNTGRADLSPIGDSGFEFPKLSGKTCFYESGLLWGGRVKGQIRTGGSSYTSGLTPGKILPDGKPESPSSPAVRAYRVRPDYRNADLSTEIKDEKKDRQTIYNQYEKDWNEWPAIGGAPFKDVNRNGIFEPSIDIPGVPEADQTIWFVTNDLDSIQSKKLYGALPMGIEMQTTVWAYKNVDPLNNMIFKRYILINKSDTGIDDMYIGVWSDPDLGGDAGDDLVGCDTLLNLDFCYNGDDSDPSYGNYIPSVGFLLLQGPIIKATENDVAKFLGREVRGKKNMQMTALGYFGKGGTAYHDPSTGSYEKGTLQVYNLLQGKLNLGEIVLDPFTGRGTPFPFSGDPVTGKGFLGGVAYPNGWDDRKYDHRMMLCSGPFNMAAGDTQEIVFAQMAAGGDPGYSRFASISLLKKSTSFAQKLYKSNFIPPAPLKNIPNLQAIGMDREIVLTWGNDVDKVKEIENFPPGIYFFQGYNVYQISKNESTLGDKKLIASFDLKDGRLLYLEETVDPIRGYVQNGIRQFGTDSGIQRFISIKKDFLNNMLLNNGSDYEFGVSYFCISADLNFPYGYIESELSTVTIKPQSLKPGIRYESKFGDIVDALHVTGNSLAKVTALILDPPSVTGNEYEIYFKFIDGRLSFNLKNITTNKVLLSDQFNFSGDNDFIVTEGFILRVEDNQIKPLNDGDVYRLTTPHVTYDNKLAAEDIEKINVFPNPYYGNYSNEFNKYDRHITFSHLPPRAVIRIFNLAGHLVRRLEKDSPDQFLRWNMLNESFFQIPSGIYVVHVDLPDLGKYKIIKLAIFTENFIPETP